MTHFGLRSGLLSRILALSIYIAGAFTPVHGAGAETNAESLPAPTPPPAGLASPRATMHTFVGAMNDIKRGAPERIEGAVATLDLAAINALNRRERGADLAWTLLEVMDRTRLAERG